MSSGAPIENPHVLILGAGLVSRPIVRFFLDVPHCRVTVASLALDDAHKLVQDHPSGTARQVDVSDPGQLGPLIQESDLVVSLVPYAFHVTVARLAIEHRVQMVTTSYVSPEMRALDGAAREAGVTILNEIGLDPGLDHMSAMRMIELARSEGRPIVEFFSCCGGLPSPEAANNPWRYKFSWSPRGALLASRLSARFLERGRVVNVPGDALFAHSWPLEIDGLGSFEFYPNRDSLRYIDAYGLTDIQGMLRATLRWPGWCHAMKALADLGLLAVEERRWPAGATYADFFATFLPPGDATPVERLAARLGLPPDDDVIRRLEWAGLLGDDALPFRDASPLDILAERFASRMAYAPGERDMVVLRHEMRVQGEKAIERRVSQLVAFGEPGGDSATARSVSLPAAVAGRLLLEGRLAQPGVQIPTRPEIYAPVLGRLEARGLQFREWSEPLVADSGVG